jgi:hypothetical protein
MHVSGFHCGVNEICIPLELYAAQISSLLPMFRVNLSVPSSSFGMTDNLDDESMPNHLVAYSVQIMQMRKSPHEQMVGVSKSPNMFQLSSKFFQAE